MIGIVLANFSQIDASYNFWIKNAKFEVFFLQLCITSYYWLLWWIFQARKIRNRKLKRQSSQWEIREASETTDNSSVELNSASPEITETSELSSPTNSDTTTTTICLFQDNDQAVPKEKKRDDSRKFTTYLFPVALLVLIFLGKLCAIFLTSTWLFGISTLSNDPENSSLGERDLHLKHYLRGPLSDLWTASIGFHDCGENVMMPFVNTLDHFCKYKCMYEDVSSILWVPFDPPQKERPISMTFPDFFFCTLVLIIMSTGKWTNQDSMKSSVFSHI